MWLFWALAISFWIFLYVFLFVWVYIFVAMIPFIISKILWWKYKKLLLKLWILFSWIWFVWLLLIILACITEKWKEDEKDKKLTFENIWNMFKSI